MGIELSSRPDAQPIERQPIGRRRRFALGRIARGDDRREQLGDARRRDDFSDLVTQGARCDGNRHLARGGLDELPRAGEEHRAAVQHLLELDAFACHQRGNLPLVHAQAAVARERLEHADVVEAEIARVVLAFGEGDVLLGEDLLIGAAVERFAVRDDAVEVEDDRLQNRRNLMF